MGWGLETGAQTGFSNGVAAAQRSGGSFSLFFERFSGFLRITSGYLIGAGNEGMAIRKGAAAPRALGSSFLNLAVMRTVGQRETKQL